MRSLKVVILFCFCSLSILAAETEGFRSWITIKGHFLDFKFEKYIKAKVLLKDKDGKSVSIETKNLSVVDRLYLIDEHNVPQADLLEGYKDLLEARYKQSRSEFMKKGSIVFTYDGGKVKLYVIDTPHFKILSEERLDTDEVSSYFESLWFYQAYRNPIFLENMKGLKNTVFVTASDEFLSDLLDWSFSLKKKVTALERKQHEIDKYASLRSIIIPSDYSASESLKNFAYVVRSDEIDFLGKEQFRVTAAYSNFLMRRIGLNDIFSIATDAGHYFLYGVGFDAEMTFHEEVLSSFSFEGESPKAWGEASQWTKSITKAVKKGTFKYSLSDYHSGGLDLITKPLFGEYITAVSMFIRSDMTKELATARYLKLVAENGAQTTLEEFVNCYGYKDAAEMEVALLDYIAKNKVK